MLGDIIVNNRVRAWWWRDKTNFGDCLTPYIINKLSGLDVVHIGCSLLDAIKYILKRWKAGLSIDFKLVWPIYLFEQTYILSVGSILGHHNHKCAIVWGSGFIRKTDKFYGKKAIAVRGRFSAQRLVELGHPYVDVWGDPALLLPILYQPKDIQRKKRLAIVPNFSEYQKFKSFYGQKFDVIDLNTDNIEATIDLICSYDYILSTSLHGLIISHAYGIPAIWIEDVVLADDSFHFKFKDYFSSVGITYYNPFKNIKDIINTDIEKFFDDNKEKYLLKKKITTIQNDLLSVAPFPIRPEFKKKLL